MAEEEEGDQYVDSAVSAYMDTNWREAMRAAREGMECIRKIHPELSEHISETGARSLGRALADLEASVSSLHRAGRYIIGATAYDEYLQTLAHWQVER